MVYCFRHLLVAATTHDYNVFSFHHDNSPCHGFEEVLACYRKIVPHLRLSGDDQIQSSELALQKKKIQSSEQLAALFCCCCGSIANLSPDALVNVIVACHGRADVVCADRGGGRRHRGPEQRAVPCSRHSCRRTGACIIIALSENQWISQTWILTLLKKMMRFR